MTKALLALMFLLTLGAAAQDVPKPQTKAQGNSSGGRKITLNATSNYDLVEARAVPSSAPADLILIGCSDAENNYYLEQQGGNQASGPIVKFDKNGRLRATFVLPAGLTGSRFIVDENQGLYRLAIHIYDPNAGSQRESDFERLVLVYTKDGSLQKQVKLEVSARLMPYQIGVFSSGDFLVSGNWRTNRLDDPPQFYTALFTSEGKLVKKLTLTEDDRLMQPSDFNYGPGLNNAVSGGHVVLASDENLYLMRRTLPTVIYAISPGGEVVRTLTVDSDGTGLYPMNLVSSKGHLAIMFNNLGNQTGRPEFLKVIDLEGNSLAAYQLDPHAGTMLLSFQSSKFTFLTQHSGTWYLADLVPR